MAEFSSDNKPKGGRKKGSTNKATKELREMLGKLVDKNFSQIQDDLDALEPLDRINSWIKLAQIVIPKQIKTEVSKTTTTKTLNIISATTAKELNDTIDITPEPVKIEKGASDGV